MPSVYLMNWSAMVTRDQERLANFAYAAPEQRTRGLAVDAKADFYAQRRR